jgi:hypothetical protein
MGGALSTLPRGTLVTRRSTASVPRGKKEASLEHCSRTRPVILNTSPTSPPGSLSRYLEPIDSALTNRSFLVARRGVAVPTPRSARRGAARACQPPRRQASENACATFWIEASAPTHSKRGDRRTVRMGAVHASCVGSSSSSGAGGATRSLRAAFTAARVCHAGQVGVR